MIRFAIIRNTALHQQEIGRPQQGGGVMRLIVRGARTPRGLNGNYPFTVGNGGAHKLVPEVVYSSSGVPIQVWTPEMPRIEDQILDSVIYLYHSVDEAKQGVSYGGAGFLMQVRTELPNQMLRDVPEGPLFRYAVTNKHVVDGGATVIRINTRDGGTDEIPLARNQWIDHPTADLSVAQIHGLDHFTKHQVRYIPDGWFLTEATAKAMKLGPGDDVYMVGRFIAHDGRQRNQPFVQSGIVSLMPTDVETDWDDAGNPTKTEELFLIEMRSLGGCSGSPVFFELHGPIQTRRMTPENRELLQRRWLLGIDCGHFRNYEKVFEVKERGSKKDYKKTSYEAVSNAGQMMVVPAWKLLELLEDPRLAMVRKEKTEKKAQRQANSRIERDSRTREDAEITPEGFEEALRRASRKTSSQPESESDET